MLYIFQHNGSIDCTYILDKCIDKNDSKINSILLWLTAFLFV